MFVQHHRARNDLHQIHYDLRCEPCLNHPQADRTSHSPNNRLHRPCWKRRGNVRRFARTVGAKVALDAQHHHPWKVVRHFCENARGLHPAHGRLHRQCRIRRHESPSAYKRYRGPHVSYGTECNPGSSVLPRSQFLRREAGERMRGEEPTAGPL